MTYLAALYRYFDPNTPVPSGQAARSHSRAADVLSAFAWGFTVTTLLGCVRIWALS